MTEANTLVNARALITRSDLKKLKDSTNSKVDDSPNMSQNKTIESNQDTSLLPFNTTFEPDSMINNLNSTNIEYVQINVEQEIENTSILKDDYDKNLENTFEESVLLENHQNETIQQLIPDSTCISIDSPPKASPSKSLILSDQNKTYEVVANTTTKSQFMDDFTEKSQMRVDETQTIQKIHCITITEPSIINKTYDLEKTQVNNKTIDIEPSKEIKPSSPSMLSTSTIQSSILMSEKNRSINKSGFNLSVLNETLSNCADLIVTNGQNLENELKMALERSQGIVDRMKAMRNRMEEASVQKKQELDKMIKKNLDKNNEIERIKAENLKMKNEIEQIRLNASNDPELMTLLVDCGEANSIRHENELKNLVEKNKNNEKEIKDAKRKLDNLKDNVDIGFDQIESLRVSRDEKEKLTRLYRLIFDENFIDFNVVNFDQDTIQLSFFNDLIKVQIKATNLVNDLATKFCWQPNESNEFLLDDVNKKFKYLNYPLKQINIQTNVDSYGNKILTRASRMSLSSKYSKNKIPVFVRYCIALIMGEFSLDQDGNLNLAENKFKFVKDLPIVKKLIYF